MKVIFASSLGTVLRSKQRMGLRFRDVGTADGGIRARSTRAWRRNWVERRLVAGGQGPLLEHRYDRRPTLTSLESPMNFESQRRKESENA
jgi:hypothetical protein